MFDGSFSAVKLICLKGNELRLDRRPRTAIPGRQGQPCNGHLACHGVPKRENRTTGRLRDPRRLAV